jgi:hypothetical protein
MKGWAEYMIARARTKLASQGVIIGHMPNHWGVNIPGQVGRGRKEAHLFSGMTIARFINGFGAEGKGDVVFVEKTDFDAGIKGAQWFWDSTGYAKFFLWTRAISHGTKLPMVGWQMAEGNSTHPEAAKRDDIVETFLNHPSWWTDGGFAGILFGGGNPGCANYAGTDDGGWYGKQVSAYQQSPLTLPLVSSIRNPLADRVASGIQARVAGSSLRLEGWDGLALVQVRSASGALLWSSRQRAGEAIALGAKAGWIAWKVDAPGLHAAGRSVLP